MPVRETKSEGSNILIPPMCFLENEIRIHMLKEKVTKSLISFIFAPSNCSKSSKKAISVPSDQGESPGRQTALQGKLATNWGRDNEGSIRDVADSASNRPS